MGERLSIPSKDDKPRGWASFATAGASFFFVTMLVVSAIFVALMQHNSESVRPTQPSAVEASGLRVVSGVTRFDAASRALAPVVEGETLDGGESLTSHHLGRVVVVNVWQSTCEPCREEAEGLNLASRTAGSAAVFIGLNVIDQKEPAQEFDRSVRGVYPHIFDPEGKQLNKFVGILPLQAIPSTAVIDPRGRVAARVIGPVSKETLLELIRQAASSS